MRKMSSFTHELMKGLRFYRQAKTLYQVHSPTAFALLQSLQNHSALDKQDENKIEVWWNTLKKDHTSLSENFGHGSRRKAKSSISKASIVSSNSQSKANKISLIFKYFDCKNLLEFGTNLGRTTATMSLVNQNARVHSVEGNGILVSKSKELLKHLDINNCTVHHSSFSSFIQQQPSTIANTDGFYLDGDHCYQACMENYLAVRAQKKKLCFIMDDIHWSPGMTKVWNEIIGLENNALIIDFFKFGLIQISPDFPQKTYFRYIDQKYKPFTSGLRS